MERRQVGRFDDIFISTPQIEIPCVWSSEIMTTEDFVVSFHSQVRENSLPLYSVCALHNTTKLRRKLEEFEVDNARLPIVKLSPSNDIRYIRKNYGDHTFDCPLCSDPIITGERLEVGSVRIHTDCIPQLVHALDYIWDEYSDDILHHSLD